MYSGNSVLCGLPLSNPRSQAVTYDCTRPATSHIGSPISASSQSISLWLNPFSSSTARKLIHLISPWMRCVHCHEEASSFKAFNSRVLSLMSCMTDALASLFAKKASALWRSSCSTHGSSFGKADTSVPALGMIWQSANIIACPWARDTSKFWVSI
ncbi:hypothetical protein D9M72_562500 [compost metagenome]